MINKINIENFKSLQKIELNCSNLTILAGLNGMGKSSIIQVLLLLRQSYLNNVIKDSGLALKGSLIDIGVGKDVLYQYADKEEISICLHFKSDQKLSWIFGYDTDSDLLPLIKNPPKNTKFDILNLFSDAFQYIQAEHWIPKNTFDRSDYEVVKKRSLGSRGEYAPHFLAVNAKQKVENRMLHEKGQSKILLHQTQAWLSDISPGTKINSKELAALDAIRLTYQFETEDGYTDEFKHFNVGFGITYALPVIVSLLAAFPGDLVIIENPESHLHPKGQASMGKLISLAAERGVQIIVETHSDHLLNAARVAVKKGDLNKSNLKIAYFDRDKNILSEHRTKIFPINIDEKGELDEYPQGFLDEWANQLMHLI